MPNEPKMFNRAIVFGSVLKAPIMKMTANGKPYASVQFQCPNDLYGNIRVWGKIWGDRAQDAMTDLKPGMKVRMQGVFQQYENDYGRSTNFNFFDFSPLSMSQAEDLRAVFILVADVASVYTFGSEETDDLMTEICLRYQHGDGPVEEYKIYAEADSPIAKRVSDELVGQRVKFKGVLQQKENFFGEATPVRAYVKELEVCSIQEAVVGPQTKPDGGSGADEDAPF